MSFRQFGGLQFASKHNAVSSYYNTSNNLLVTQNVGQSNSFINFLSDISGNQISGNLDVSGNINVTGNIDISGNINVGGDIDVSGNLNAYEIFLTAPFHSYASNEVVPKTYVDTVGAGLKPQGQVRVISSFDSSSNNTLEGYPVPIYPYFIGLPFYIDGVSINVGDNVLLNDQGTNYGQNSSVNNGVYTLVYDELVSGYYQFIRSDTIMPVDSSSNSAYIAVLEGTVNALSGWIQVVEDNSNTVGTTPLLFSQYFSFAFRVGQGLYTTTQNEQVYINVDSSLNFINYLDGSNNDTINVGTNTNTVNIGKTNTGSIYLNTPLVGVGKSSAYYPLDVSGEIHATSNIVSDISLYANNLYLNGDGTNGYIRTYNTGTSSLFLGIQDYPQAIEIDPSGNVGIGGSGTASPYFKLSVNAAIRVFDSYYDIMGVFSPDYGNYLHIGSWDQTGTIPKNIVLNQYGSNVGIGNNNPQYALDVSGNTTIRGQLNVLRPENSQAGGISYNDILSYNSGYYSQIYQSGVGSAFINQAPLGLTNFYLNNGTSTFNALSISQSSGNPKVGIGNASPVYTLDVSGNINLTGNFYKNGLPYPGTTQWSNGSNSSIYYTGGSVGIGITPSSSYALDVSGNIHLNDSYDTTNKIIFGGYVNNSTSCNKIDLYNGTKEYGFGIASETLVYNSYGYHNFYTGSSSTVGNGTLVTQINSSGLTIYGNNSSSASLTVTIADGLTVNNTLTCANITQTSPSKGNVNIPSTTTTIVTLYPFLNNSGQAAKVTFSNQGIYLVIGFLSGLKPTQTQNGYQMSITIQNTNTSEYLWTNGCQYYGDGSGGTDGVYLQVVGYLYCNGSTNIQVQLLNTSDFNIGKTTGGGINWIKIG